MHNKTLTAAERLKREGNASSGIIAARYGDSIIDLHSEVDEETTLTPIDFRKEEALDFIRHSAAHIMADAVQRLFPGTKVTIGPSIENGFYYDFDPPDRHFTDEDLPLIEEEMKKIIDSRAEFRRVSVSRKEAQDLFSSMGETYKLEILQGIPEDTPVTLYYHGDWVDLCAGPHVPDTSFIKSFKLTGTAGAYWRGDERNKMLSRIYGTVFASKKDLKVYLKRLEEARKRDHRRLGVDLDLFSINPDTVGGGLVMWHPRGARVRTIVEDFWRQAHLDNGYDLVMSPHIGRSRLWETSGHLDHFAENMYSPMNIEGQDYYIKPMNCPFHISIYKSRLRSYRELPLRWAELGTVYRFERSGQLHGLLRVRGFTQDDAHLFLTREQLKSEIAKMIRFSIGILAAFGFEDLDIKLSTRPERHIGDLSIWDEAEKALADGLDSQDIAYSLDPGEGTFYGPKIDIKIRDAIGRAWQCTTIQVDFNEPERFDITYIGEDGAKHRPVMLHRTLLGSLERFMGVLIEHYAGAFPLWLAPEQVAVLTVAGRHETFAGKVLKELNGLDIRASVDAGSSKLGAKIREARLRRVPHILVIGDREEKENGVSLRSREKGDEGFISLESYLERVSISGRMRRLGNLEET